MSSTQPLLTARYASRVAITGVGNGVASAVSAALMLPLLVSALGIQQYGQWAMLGMFITTAAVLDLGLSRAIVISSAGQSAARVRECGTAAVLLATGIMSLAVLFIVGLSVTTDRLLGFAPAPLDMGVLLGGCAILALGMLNGVSRAILESQLAAHWVNVGYVVQTLLFYGLTLLAARFWREGVIFATVMALVCVLLLHAVLLARAGLLRPLWPATATVREMLRAGWQSWLLAAPTAILPPLAAMLVLSKSADPGAFGIFDIAFRVATLSSTLLASIAMPVLTLSARAHASGTGGTQLQHWIRRYLMLGWCLYALGMLTLWLAGPWLLGSLFPAAGPALFPLAFVLVGGMGAVAASEPVARAMLGSHHPAPVLLARLIMMVVVLTAGTWLLERDGIMAFGSVYAVAGLLATMTLLFAWFASRRALARA